MSRTIRECLEDSLKLIEIEEGGKPMIPFPLPYFIRSMAVLLLWDADVRLKEPVPSVELGDLKINGSAVENPKLEDYIAVLSHRDFMRSQGQIHHLIDFLEWFLDQEEPELEDCDGSMWYDISVVARMWNEYIEESKHDHD